MYSDLFDQLGGGGGGGAAGRRGGADAGSTSRVASGPPPLVSCKAGKMILEQTSSDSSQFQCKPESKRGEIRLVYADSTLQWQWFDRREQKVVDRHLIMTDNSAATAGTFERVSLSGKKHELDRVYVWTHYEADSAQKPKYDMYWMQDQSEENEEELVAKINQYLADPSTAAPKPEEGSAAAVAVPASSAAVRPASNSDSGVEQQSQVDALSSILENLGMPQSDGGTPGGGGAGAGSLTLADLQGAMAGMQQPAQQQSVPLTEVVTPAAVESLLENDEIANRLLELLPENQRSRELLAENLRSPQVQQTLRSLTQALLPDDAGNMDGFASVLANFSLPTDDSTTAAAMANPIQAFLDAVLKSVQTEEKGEDKMQEEEKEGGGDE